MGVALAIVDMLNDFVAESGLLYFPKSRSVIRPIQAIKSVFRGLGAPVLYFNDAHPPDSKEFASWPAHCLVGSSGGGIIQELSAESGDVILCKDSINCFQDGVAEKILRGLEVTRLYIVGVAVEYCVRSCALEAMRSGFSPCIIADAVAGVDLASGDVERALEEMRFAGVDFIDASALFADMRR